MTALARFVRTVDQDAVATLSACASAPPARRTPKFWRAFVPAWIAVDHEGDLVHLSVVGRRRHAAALDQWIAGSKILTASVVARSDEPWAGAR